MLLFVQYHPPSEIPFLLNKIVACYDLIFQTTQILTVRPFRIPPQTTIKIFTSCLRVDIEYKTLGIQWETTADEVVRQVLRRCKMRHRDPRLFYLSMEVMIRKAGVKTLLKLEDEARPALLQACHPKGDSR